MALQRVGASAAAGRRRRGDRGLRYEQDAGQSTIEAGLRSDGRPVTQPGSAGVRNARAPRSAGGGDGGQSNCSWAPVGPIAEVQAAQAAVNAEQLPSVADPNYVEDVIGARTVSSAWYRVTGTTAEVKGFLRCDGEQVSVSWRSLAADGTGNLVVQISAQDLLPGVRDRVVRRLPTPEVRVGPADEDPDGWTYVQNRTFFWVDQGAGPMGDRVSDGKRRRHQRDGASRSSAPGRRPR